MGADREWKEGRVSVCMKERICMKKKKRRKKKETRVESVFLLIPRYLDYCKTKVKRQVH